MIQFQSYTKIILPQGELICFSRVHSIWIFVFFMNYFLDVFIVDLVAFYSYTMIVSFSYPLRLLLTLQHVEIPLVLIKTSQLVRLIYFS